MKREAHLRSRRWPPKYAWPPLEAGESLVPAVAAKQTHVLVVEDEALIRMSAAFSLEDAGYIVHQAGDVAEALRILDAHRDLELIFTDVDLPGGLKGTDLVDHARRERPDLKILVTSGAPRPVGLSAPFLPKPYALSHLVDSVAGLLSTLR